VPHEARPAGLPTGTVTFLFSDIEGSTRLLERLGTAAYSRVLDRHQRIVRAAIAAADGTEIGTEGDSFFVVFRSAPSAVRAAVEAQRGLSQEAWPEGVELRVRMGLHTGEGVAAEGADYVGLDVHRAARIAAAANGGQVLVSATTLALTDHALPAGVIAVPLGWHRLRDLDQPELLARLEIDGGPRDPRAPRSLETASNLPAQLTSLVGRAREVAAVRALLGGSRLVTLSGPGGTGKTRLSLAVAEAEVATSSWPDGVWFVELAPIVEPDLVAPSLAAVLGLREEAGRSVEEQLRQHVRDRRLLTVLDNFEQVIGAAPLVGRLLAAGAGLTVLVTSREVLHVRGEQEFPVPPLAVPDPAHLPEAAVMTTFEAVQLFVARARAVDPAFSVTDDNAAVVAAICARLDGLPLAIELAAARIKLFGPAALLARLEGSLAVLASSSRDVPERQRTLRGAIAWSYDLLSPAEQAMFRRLGVFVGSWTFEAAATVCDPDGALGLDIVTLVESLVDRSLVRPLDHDTIEPRFAMLALIR
jgi:predicted ATPase/class 3 adenylate cyclase